MRAFALAVGLALLASACGSDDGPAAATELEITVWPDGRAAGGASSTVTLTCDPPGGTHPSPADACRALAAHEDALEPTPPDRGCIQLYGGPEAATVNGTYRGRVLSASFSRKDGCEIARWDALAPLFAGAHA